MPENALTAADRSDREARSAPSNPSARTVLAVLTLLHSAGLDLFSAAVLPGWGAPGSLYTPGLAPGWTVLEPPSFAATRGSLGSYRSWLLSELGRRTVPSCLAGHSMGGELAVLAAAAAPEMVSRLVLISPAGLPLRKPMTASLGRFASQAATGRYASTEMVAAVGRVARAPRAALRLARAVRSLDLEQEMRAVRASGVPVEVVGCATDTLVTRPTPARSPACSAAPIASSRARAGTCGCSTPGRPLRASSAKSTRRLPSPDRGLATGAPRARLRHGEFTRPPEGRCHPSWGKITTLSGNPAARREAVIGTNSPVPIAASQLLRSAARP